VLPRLDEDRLTPILDHLSKGFVAGVPSELPAEFESSEVIRADQVEHLSKHFPLCMRAMHINLRKDRHLKHQGRLQYGLFLKVLLFQRFSKQIISLASTGHWSPNRRSPSLLEKELPRILQGRRRQVREGICLQYQTLVWSRWSTTQLHPSKVRISQLSIHRRADRPDHSCATIITITPGSDENHGCPFRHYSEPALRSALESTMGVSGMDLNDVMSLVKGNHLQVACTRVFEITRGLKRGEGLRGETIEHPNVYTSISREMEQAKNGVEEKAGPKPTDGAQEMTID